MIKFDSYYEAYHSLEKVDQSDIEQLRLECSISGRTIAYELIKKGLFDDKYINDEVLELNCTRDGKKVIHILATKGLIDDGYINHRTLKIANNDNRTLAHVLASMGKLPVEYMTSEVLRYRTISKGYTVAFNLASCGKLPDEVITPEILLLKTNDGIYVYNLINKYNIDNMFSLDEAKSEMCLYLMSYVKYNFSKISYSNFIDMISKYGMDKVKKLIELSGKVNIDV